VEYKLPNADKVVTNDPMEATMLVSIYGNKRLKKQVQRTLIKFVMQWQVKLCSTIGLYPQNG
jgi:hypothetical protein